MTSGAPGTQAYRSELTEYLWLVALLAMAAGLRMYQLAETPFHHDESIHAYLSYLLWDGHAYRFDPVFHGPFLYWTNALMYSVVGVSDFTARLAPALSSVALLLPLWLLRDLLGRIGWKVAAALLVLSPTFTYYGRFLAHDNYCAIFTLLLVYLASSDYRKPTAWRMIAMGLVIGLFLATKAVVFITLGMFTAFAILVFALNTFAPAMPRALLWQRTLQWLPYRKWHMVMGLLALLASYTALYSSFFTHWAGLYDGIFASIQYWAGQHNEPRIPGPVYYYLPRLLLHEPVSWLALPALVWAARGKQDPWNLFLAFWIVAALAIYGFAQEKVPWLLIHMLLPMLLLVGRWVDHLWQSGNARLLSYGLLSLSLCWSLRETLWLNFQMTPAAPHLLTYMATTVELKNTAREIRELDTSEGQIFLSGRATWPLAWYLRDSHVTFELPIGWEQTALLVEANEDERENIEAAGFTGHTYPLMSWWYPNMWQLFSTGLPTYLGHRASPPLQDKYDYIVFRRSTNDLQKRFEND